MWCAACSAAFVGQQIAALCTDFTIQASKISIVYRNAVIQVLLAAIDRQALGMLVMDPVLAASSGWSFFIEQDFHLLLDLLRRADLITPNLPEAARLLGSDLEDVQADPGQAIARLHRLGMKHILLKGGHQRRSRSSHTHSNANANANANTNAMAQDKTAWHITEQHVTDFFSDGKTIHALTHPYVATVHTSGFHGTVCVLSAAITACLAQGMELLPAIHQARGYLLGLMQQAGSADTGTCRLL